MRSPDTDLKSISERCFQPRCLRKLLLSDIERQKVRRREMFRRGDVEDIEAAVAGKGGMRFGQVFGQAQNHIGVRRNDLHVTGGDIGLPRGQHLIRFRLAIAWHPVLSTQPDLQAHGLAKLEFQQR